MENLLAPVTHPRFSNGEDMTYEEKYARRLPGLIRRIRRYSSFVDKELLEKAYHFSMQAHRDQLRKSGEPYFEHCYQVARILTELKMDYITVAGGLLHDVVEDTGVTLEQVEDEFGREIAQLVDGVTKISELKFNSVEERQAEISAR